MHPVFSHFKPETVARLRTMDWSIDTMYGIAAIDGPRCDCPLGWALRLEGHTLPCVAVNEGWGSFPVSSTVADLLGNDDVLEDVEDFLDNYRIKLGEFLDLVPA